MKDDQTFFQKFEKIPEKVYKKTADGVKYVKNKINSIGRGIMAFIILLLVFWGLRWIHPGFDVIIALVMIGMFCGVVWIGKTFPKFSGIMLLCFYTYMTFFFFPGVYTLLMSLKHTVNNEIHAQTDEVAESIATEQRLHDKKLQELRDRQNEAANRKDFLESERIADEILLEIKRFDIWLGKVKAKTSSGFIPDDEKARVVSINSTSPSSRQLQGTNYDKGTGQLVRSPAKLGPLPRIYFNANSPDTIKTDAYLLLGQRFRAYASAPCKIYGEVAVPNTYETYTQSRREGRIPIQYYGKSGYVDIEIIE